MGSLPTEDDPTSTPYPTGASARAAARANTILSTSGLAPNYLQANLIVLPSRYAADFRLLCQRNPVPCPLLAESASPGSYTSLMSRLAGIDGSALAKGLDIRTDAPRYMVYQYFPSPPPFPSPPQLTRAHRNGVLAASHVPDIAAHWTPDHVAFLVGCSYSFEAALARAALAPRHTALGRVVPMYRTTVPLCPAGVFAGGTYVVSMRPYPRAAIEVVRKVTRPYVATHGEPVAWGWEALGRLGIRDVSVPDWGETPVTEEGGPLVVGDEENVPVFWGCGVTPQEAVMRAGGALEGVVMGHAPGHMVVLDVKDSDVF